MMIVSQLVGAGMVEANYTHTYQIATATDSWGSTRLNR
jgi:hypothetical protein